MKDFSTFINKDWLRWKYKALREAKDNSAAYAGGYGTPRVPMPMSEEDWLFLSQFHPKYWDIALQWRYNKGLLEASQSRENDPEKTLKNVKNYVPKVRFKVGNDKYISYIGEGKGIYVGLKDLIEKLEKPVKYYDEYQVSAEDNPYKPQTPEGPGLDTIHKEGRPWGEYKGGLYDVDLTAPAEISPEAIDELPDDHPWITAVHDNPDIARKKLKEAPPHSFAGMPVMQPDVSSKIISIWLRAQGLGLLDNPSQLINPSTGKPYEIEGMVPPKELYGHWPAKVGRQDGASWEAEGQSAKGREIPLEVPYTTSAVTFAEEDAEGNAKTAPQKQTFKVPVLAPGKLFPLITPTEEQREAIKHRKREGGKAKNITGQIGDLDKLLWNWDLLSDQQIKTFKENEIPLHSVLTKKYIPRSNTDVEETDFDDRDVEGEGYEEEIDTPTGKKSVRGTPFYVMGWTPNKLQRGRVNLNMTKDQLEKVIEEYWPGDSTKLKINNKNWHSDACSELGFNEGLVGEACRGVTYFMKNALGWKGYQTKRRSQGERKFDVSEKSSVLKMMETAMPYIIPTAAALLALNLNHPLMGIWAPEDGLGTLHPELRNEKGAASAQAYRMQYAYNFARDIAQAALEGHPSRRQRQSGKGWELQDISSDDGEGRSTSVLDTLQASTTPEDKERIEYLRARSLADKMKQTPRVWQIPYGDKAERPAWLVPEFSKGLARLMETKRQEIIKRIDSKIGTHLGDNVTQAAKAMMAVQETQEKIADQELKQLEKNGQNLSKLTMKQLEELEKSVNEKLYDALVEDYPEMFKALGKGGLEQLISQHKQKKGKGQEESPEVTPDEGMQWQLLDNVIGRERNKLIMYNKNSLNKILKGESAPLKGLVVGHFDKEGLNPYFWGQYDKYDFESKDDRLDAEMVSMGRFNLNDIAREIYDKTKYPNGLYDMFQSLGFRKEDAEEYIVKLLMALYQMAGQSINEKQAIEAAKQMGFNPPATAQAATGNTPVPKAAASSLDPKIQQIGQYIIAPAVRGETAHSVAMHILQNDIDPQALEPYFQQWEQELQRRLQAGGKKNSKDLGLRNAWDNLQGGDDDY